MAKTHSKKPQYDIRLRTRAAVCLVDKGTEVSQLNAFLAIFHPELAKKPLLRMKLLANARERDSKR